MPDEPPTVTVDDAGSRVETPQPPVETPAPAPAPTTPSAPETAHVPDEAPSWAQELGATVNTLIELITGAVATDNEPPPPDDTPVKIPWTHRKIFR